MDRSHWCTLARSARRVGQLAYHVCPLCALGQGRGLGAHLRSPQRRSGSRGSDARQHGGTCPPTRRRRPKKHGPQALGRSRGGFATKLHGIVDALGNPLGFTLTGAEQADITQALALLEQAPGAQAVIADKGYDSNALVEHIEAQQAEVIIPPRSNRKALRDYDRHRYKARNLVERFFNRLKQFRRVATRYEKLAAHFAAMVRCACIVLWLA